MTNLELCQSVLSTMIAQIKDDQAIKKIRASGASAESLNLDMNQAGGDIWGSDYFHYQIYGRGPGKMPPIQPIVEWIQAKQLQPDGIGIQSLAFLIARKISRLGTNIFTGTSPALAVSAIVQQGSADIAAGIGKNTAQEILDIFKILKEN